MLGKKKRGEKRREVRTKIQSDKNTGGFVFIIYFVFSCTSSSHNHKYIKVVGFVLNTCVVKVYDSTLLTNNVKIIPIHQ